ncbi:MAG: hypothetical protein M1830_005683, partial [Pleopsidium flavum]
LAVSGGVDSMALAVLCRRMNRDFHNSKVKPRAFVVDHAARSGSDVEAAQVARNIAKLGIRSNILTLQWPDNVKPLELRDFESQARRLRYQALGKACRDYGIRTLLLGHHADDQAETVLMRLADGHTGSGLQGIKGSGEIPECWGIYGVQGSGGSEQRKAKEQRKRSVVQKKRQANNVRKGEWVGRENQETLVDIEYGGVKIYRPLLGFKKEELIATCLQERTPWVDDHTNEDPTLTPRNAVRHLLKDQSLPHYLQRNSLLAISERERQKTARRAASVERLFQACQIITFDARSGGLFIRFPLRGTGGDHVPPEYLKEQINRDSYRAADLLRRVIDLVTPLENVQLRDLEFAVKTIFPDLVDPASGKVDKGLPQESFTVGGVHFRRIRSPVPSHGPAARKSILDRRFAWVVTRQPYASSQDLPRITVPPAPENSPTITTPSGKTSTIEWSAWQLFDGRFWIRVRNHSEHPIIVRPFQEQDLNTFRTSLSQEGKARFDELLDVAAPGKVRWTLPVLAREDGQMLAAVTLGVGLEELQGKVTWNVRYKKIDLGERGWDVLVQ